MTGQQILTADLLDILFENRNKAYGAYNLRRTYNHRLVRALLFTLTSIFLLLLLLPTKEKTNILLPAVIDDDVTLRLIEHTAPPIEATPALPPRPQVGTGVAQTQFNNIVIKPDAAVDEAVPAQDVIASSRVAGVTTTGSIDEGLMPLPSNSNVEVPDEAAPPAAAMGITSAPEFPGGAEAWLRFLNRHLRAPDGLQLGEKKAVLIRFLVSADGSITSFDVVQSGGAQFDNEVIRVLKKMPKWKPALQNGVPVSKTFTQPVTFVQAEE